MKKNKEDTYEKKKKIVSSVPLQYQTRQDRL